MERSCPRCKSTSYRNPTLRLMVNECGHTLCSSCVNILFIRGQAPCPQCQINLKKTYFREQMFDDPAVDKEVFVRTKLLKVYNKREADFSSEGEYDNYLEKIEELVWATMDNEEWAKDEIASYERQNQLLIRKNHAKSAKEDETLEEQIMMEKKAIDDARVKMAATEAEAERNRINEEKRLMEKIETGGDITDIMHRRTNLNVETEQRLQSESVVITAQEVKHVELYSYAEMAMETYGPSVPAQLNAYFDAIRPPGERQLAGGFTIELGLTRALGDAFSCLTWKSSLEHSGNGVEK